MDDKKISTLALLKILEEHSDEEHILTQPELLNLLDTTYNVSLDRRTLYKNIELLQNFGYDISAYSDNGRGYYLRERTFESSEISLLCNAIHSSRFIPNKASKEIIDKLLATQSKYFKSDYRRAVFMENKDKKENKEFFLNVDLLSEAIKKKVPISFNYTQYNLKKELVNRRDELYEISPHYLVYKNDKVFLIGKSAHHPDLSHYRVDKMKNVKLINNNYIRLAKNEDPYQYAKTKLYMYSGEDYRIALRCDNKILDDVIDIFGKEVNLIKHDDNCFDAYVKSSKQGIVYLALQYLDYMEILEPLEIRDEVKELLKKGQKKYK